MSAAVNDRPHPVFPHLPLTGELHPLRREFERWLFTGNAVAITTALLVFATVYFWPRADQAGMPVMIVDDHGIVNPSPPPIVVGRNDAGVDIPAPPPTGKVHYEPEKDINVLVEMDLDRYRGGGGENGEGDLGPIEGDAFGGGVVDIDVPAPPSPEVYIPFDDLPVLLSIDRPVYPEIVRAAGMEGEVLVRVLVGINGKVKDALVVEGSTTLREPALVSARSACFKPAMQGAHVVEVWVNIRIRFELSGHD